MKNLLKILALAFLLTPCLSVFADDLSIMPGGSNPGNTVGQTVRDIAVGGEVMERYKDKADELSLGEQFSSGIMNWDTILDYCVYLAKFLGQVALLAGALALIYLGYQKIRKSVKGESTPFTKIIIGILVVVFAYVIVKLIRSAFIS